MSESCATFARSLGSKRRTRAFDISSQQVSVCFVELSDSFYLEFVTPFEGNNKLARFLGVGFYHICFLVDDLKAAEERLRAEQFFALPPFESEGFAGRWCQFFLSPQRHLIELAEISLTDFREFFCANLDNPT